MRALLVVLVLGTVGCPKNPAPSSAAATAAPSALSAPAASTTAAADDPAVYQATTPEALCNAILALAPKAPPAEELAGCVKVNAQRKNEAPAAWTCEARCVAKSTELLTARNCYSMCNDPVAVCAQLAEPSKAACLTRLGKVYTLKVDAKGYACVAGCIENANALPAMVDCFGATCAL